MRPKWTLRGLPALLVVLVIAACGSTRVQSTDRAHRDLARRLLMLPREERLAAFDSLAVETQFVVFRYGMDHVEPPATELASRLARRGAAGIRLVKMSLEDNKDDVGIRDDIILVDAVNLAKTYDVAGDSVIVRVLRERVDSIRDREYKASCERMFKDMARDVTR